MTEFGVRCALREHAHHAHRHGSAHLACIPDKEIGASLFVRKSGYTTQISVAVGSPLRRS
jgi:hypothetical protein